MKAADHITSREQHFTDEIYFHLRKITKSFFVFYHSSPDSLFLAAIRGPAYAYINGGKEGLPMTWEDYLDLISVDM